MAIDAHADPRFAVLREQLAAARADWGETGEAMLDAGLSYAPGDPVRVRVRKRGNRYDIDDAGAAVAKAGKPRRWLEAAQRVVDEDWLNINRAGVVFVPAFEGRDIASLAARVAHTSLGVYDALLELQD